MVTKLKYMTGFILGGILAACVSCTHDVEIQNDKEPIKFDSMITEPDNKNTNNDYSHTGQFTAQSTVGDVINDPAFGDFGRLLFPVDRSVPLSMTLAQLSTSNVYVWYSHISVDRTVEILNYLKKESEEGKQIFYPIYSKEQIASDNSKAYTGLFRFAGKDGNPFAITNAGGGFAYVGAMHDSFPHSLEISKAGYTAFALIYRPDDPYSNLAQAITYIYDNADKLGVKREDYSLWGGSAGARMAATLGNALYLYQLTGRRDIPQAAAVIMQYTGYSAASQYDAPTYVCVGANDGIASWRTMQYRLQQMAEMGIPTEFHVYEGLGHGFGIGIGTVAEGWVNDAIKFWKDNMKVTNTSGIPPVYAD